MNVPRGTFMKSVIKTGNVPRGTMNSLIEFKGSLESRSPMKRICLKFRKFSTDERFLPRRGRSWSICMEALTYQAFPRLAPPLAGKAFHNFALFSTALQPTLESLFPFTLEGHG
jgi:hypothetical protein